MKLTKRDIEILRFINEFGFCEITQLEQKFGLKQPRCYQIMKRLKSVNLVVHERIFHGRNSVFYLTREGASCTDFPPIKNIPKDNYIHQLTIIEVYFKLMHLFPEAEWLSERCIYRDKDRYSVGRKIKHMADGVLIFPDNRKIAIEV